MGGLLVCCTYLQDVLLLRTAACMLGTPATTYAVAVQCQAHERLLT